MLKKAILLLVASFFFVLVFRSQKGISALNSNNVRGRLNIYRDHLGVAHIMADNRNDLFYGAGYTQAQDRLWTLHFKLRFLEGRVSELFG
jgi:penicillin amidase